MLFSVVLVFTSCSPAKNQYSITFETNGGAAVERQLVDENTTALQPADPSNGGYTFMGWFSDKDLKKNYNFNAKVTSDVKLYAAWDATVYPVYFDWNNGTAKEGYPGDHTLLRAQYTKSMPTAYIDFYRKGYTFQGVSDKAKYLDITDTKDFYYWRNMASAKNWDKTEKDSILYGVWEPLTFTASLNDNGGSGGSSSVVATFGDPMPSANKPSLEGYDFDGYFDELSEGEQYYSNTMTSAKAWDKDADADLWAYWTKVHAFNFDSLGGTSVNSLLVRNNEAATKPTDPTKTGHNFVGWYEEKALLNLYDFSSLVEKARTVYAQWVLKTYNVALDSDGGTGGATSLTATYSEPMPRFVSAPTRSGFDFGGYYAANNMYYDAKMVGQRNWDMDVESPELFATWTPKTYTVTLDATGGKDGVATVLATFGEPMRSVTYAPSRVGYAFDGYFASSAPESTQYYSSRMTSAHIWDITDSEPTLYAHWTPAVYSISYKNVDNEILKNPTTFTIADDVTLTSPVKSGYVFVGWFDALTGGTEVPSIKAGTSANVALYARWTPEVYTITYNVGAGTHDNPTTYDIESAVVLKAPVQEGYTFGGWYANSDYTGDPITTIAVGSKGNLALFAKWTRDGYTITYTLNEGKNNDLNPTDYTVASGPITLKDPSRTGYDFSGWYTTSAFTGDPVKTIPVGSTGDISLFAKWVPKTTLISLTLQNGGNETSQVVATYDSKMPAAVKPTLAGFRFLGFYDATTNGVQYYDSDMNSSKIWDKEVKTFELYAYWEQIKYQISFDAQNGEGGPDLVWVVAGDLMPQIENSGIPTRKDGYKFFGYYDKPQGEGAMYYDSALQSTVRWFKTKDATLFAYWKK